VSLETPIGEEEDSHLGDFIPDDDAPAPSEAASYTLLKEQLISVLRSGGYTILGDPYLLPAKRFIAEGGTVKEEEMRRVGLID